MSDKSSASRSDLLSVAKTCCGDCDNCGAIGFEIDRLQGCDHPADSSAEPVSLVGLLKRLGLPPEPRS